MTKSERYAWGSLIATAAIFYFFQMRMLDGWTVVEQPATAIFGTFVIVVVLSIIAEGVLAGYVFSDRLSGPDADERDKAIEARANANSGIFYTAALSIIALQTIAAEAFVDHPRFDDLTVIAINNFLALDSAAKVFFTLFSLIFVAHFVKLISSLWMYRR